MTQAANSATPADRQETGMGVPARLGAGALGLGLVALSVRPGPPILRLGLAAAGMGLSLLGIRGRNPLADALKIEQTPQGDVLVRDAVTVGKPADALYALWRPLETLPQRMTHLQSVEVIDEKRSRWTVKAPTPLGEVSWEAEITADEPGQRLAWKSLPGARIENEGEVVFRPAPGDRGTELVVRLSYKPPLGATGAAIARLFQQEPAQQLRDDLARFKSEQEVGHAPITRGQSSGRGHDVAGRQKDSQDQQDKKGSAA